MPEHPPGMPVGYTRECETTISPFHGVGALPDLFVFQSDHPSAVRKELEYRRAACMSGEQGEWAQGISGVEAGQAGVGEAPPRVKREDCCGLRATAVAPRVHASSWHSIHMRVV